MMGVVVIGRNEGPRLLNCLQSVLPLACPVVYADSHSTDTSVALAEGLGVTVVRLDPARPMNAARGRKEGFDCLLQAHPGLEQVLFIDGDCELHADFVPAAQAVLAQQPEVAVVCGRRSERHPQASVYNRIADLEWNTPVGVCDSCGGDALMRVSAYVKAGGFDATVLAGEEPELCARLRQLGFTVWRIDVAMTRHDMNMHRLKQWWQRGVRSGYGALHVRRRHGVQDFNRLIFSAWVWVMGWPVLSAVLVAVAGFTFGATAAGGLALLVLALLPLQVMRVARSCQKRGLGRADALAYGALMMVNKWSSAWGQLKWWRDQGANTAQRPMHTAWQQDLLRYPPRPFLKEQSIWAIAVYRWGHGLFKQPNSWRKRLLVQLYWLCFRLVETVTGISLPHNAQIGGGLRIHHFGNIFVNPGVVIGCNCTLRQGVTIGNRVADGPVPTIGNDVEFGAYAQVLGDVHIGDGARLGAMSVVLVDVPSGRSAVGNPARIIRVPGCNDPSGGNRDMNKGTL